MPNTYFLPEKLDEKGNVIFPLIKIHQTLQGFKPVIFWWNPEHDGFPEPYEVYHEVFSSYAEAEEVAKIWSKMTGIRYAEKYVK